MVMRRLRADGNVPVFPQGRKTFMSGLELYRARPDSEGFMNPGRERGNLPARNACGW
jgi:hypothetical protein